MHRGGRAVIGEPELQGRVLRAELRGEVPGRQHGGAEAFGGDQGAGDVM